jgi:hypothetical protein
LIEFVRDAARQFPESGQFFCLVKALLRFLEFVALSMQLLHEALHFFGGFVSEIGQHVPRIAFKCTGRAHVEPAASNRHEDLRNVFQMELLVAALGSDPAR